MFLINKIAHSSITTAILETGSRLSYNISSCSSSSSSRVAEVCRASSLHRCIDRNKAPSRPRIAPLTEKDAGERRGKKAQHTQRE
ncbi:hypothetical protein E2C01_035849 [Portunus trituberculatus]|uniref:Uncharacterized protein n=1 Tax=Portunus trituberculatus TaxID=210409 RepID=A0A5B7FAU1_PORTR|nr:hypothetical protein [Portunus trituberculatus]